MKASKTSLGFLHRVSRGHSKSLLAMITKDGVPNNEWVGLYYALLEVSMDKIVCEKGVRVDDRTAELAFLVFFSNLNDFHPIRWIRRIG